MADAKKDIITVSEAQRVLGVSKTKMARLIAEGILHAEPDPLDNRYKLLSRAEVEALKARSSRSRQSERGDE